jgi:ATP-dependent DNA ligase
MIANTSSPYAFDLLELKGSDLRRESLLKQNAAAIPMACAAHHKHSDTGHNKQCRRARRKAIYATFKMSIYHTGSIDVASGGVC